MREITLLLIVTFNIFCYSCSKDDIVTPDKALLKVKYWYHSVNDTIPIRRHEYQYDNSKRLERINHYGKNTDVMIIYELFKYNIDNEMENKYTYSYCCDSLGWLLDDSTHYSYENGKLILEETYYPPPNDYQVSVHYEYDGSKVTKETRYDHSGFAYCIEYLYNNEVCVKETRYSDLEMEYMSGYTKHFYNGNLRIRTERYTSQDHNFQIITYTYDVNGNLITEESIKTDFTVVAPIEYFYRYEYYL
jgi:hypothetical protein